MSWSYRPALDGLRSVAVYLVLLFHCGLASVGGGFIGVDLFFVLSGFLVSNVILSELDSTGRLSLGRFYARRVRRLLPAAVVVVVATSLMFLLTTSLVRRVPLVTDAQSALLYVANWNFLSQQNDYFATGVDESPFLHFWSLAIEEQFYVVFPVLLLLLVRASRRWSGATVAVLVGLLVLSLGSQLLWAGVDPNRAYYGTDARLYQLLAGALLAVTLRGLARRPGSALAGTGALAGLAVLLLLGSGAIGLSPSWRGVGATLASVVLIAGLMLSDDGWLSRRLSGRTPVYLGKVSYGTYLWHWPVILVLREVLAVGPAVLAVIAAVLSTGLAVLSYEVFEMPIRTVSHLRRYTWSTVVAGVAASALVATAVVPVVLESDRKPRLVQAAAVTWAPGSTPGGTATATPASTTVGPTDRQRRAPVPAIDWRAVLDDTGPMPPCSVERPQDCVVVRGDGPHIALVGDSQARMLGPMFIRLAQEHDLTLSLNVMPACSWQAGLVNVTQPLENQRKCRSLRAEWYDDALPVLDPDLVVLATLPRDDEAEWAGNLVRDGGSDETLSELNFAVTTETLDTITAQGRRALVVTSMLGTPGMDPLDCLATATRLDQCEVPVPAETPVSDAYYRIASERSADVFTLDVNPIICVGAPRCLPVVDDIVVWKNRNHFTTMIATHFRREVWSALRATGALRG